MKRFRRSYFTSLLFAFALLGSMFVGNRPASALVSSQAAGSSPPAKAAQQPTAANSTVVVTAANMQGWFFLNEGGIGSGAMVTGPGAPPLGSGSVGLTIGADGREDLDTQHFANTRLDQITALSFSTNGPTNTQAVTLQLDVNYDGVSHWEGRLVYEPYLNGTVTANTWQNWNALTGVWWASGAPGNTNCGQAHPCTLTQILGYWPNATISAASAGGELLLRAGGPWPAGTYNADALTVGVGGNNTTYDFANSQTLTVDDNHSPCTTAAYTSIQAAVDAASPGDVVQVCGGTYVEQLDINKAITVNGSGQGSAIIQSPATLATKFITGSGPKKPIVFVHDANATVRNLTVDGLGLGNNNNAMVGVAFYNAGGTLDHTTIVRVRNTPLDGIQAGVGVYAFIDNSTSWTLNLSNNTISDYQKNGMALNGAGLTANVTNNTVTGAGPLPNQAQNGVQIGFGATGTVANNTIAGNSYTQNTDSAAGILFYQSNADTNGNTLTQNQVGISRAESSGVDTGNTINATAGGTGANPFWGIVADAPPPNRVPSPAGDGAQQPRQPQQTNPVQTNTLTNNSLTSDGSSGGIAIETDGGYGSYGTYDMNFVANHNTITHWGSDGLLIHQCTTPDPCVASNFNNVVASNNTVTNNNIGISVDGGQITGPVHLNNNHIQGNTLYGIRNTTSPATIVDGTNNWWGATGGPTLGGTNPMTAGDTVGTNINYSPFVVGQDYAHLAPGNQITVLAGTRVTLDLYTNATTQAAIAQQSYLTFPPALLQNVTPGGVLTNTVTEDLTTFTQHLQNAVDNTAGQIAYASGVAFGNPAVAGDFRVAQITFATSAVGDAVVHWQFSPPDPANRNSKIVDNGSNTVSDPTLYQDYTIHVVHPQFIGHVTWEGRTTGTPAYALPINLTLTNTSTNVVYTFSTTTDTSGNFSVDVNALPNGNYNWHVKDPQYLSSSGGPVALTGVAVPPTVEMGTQRAGDANNDNLVDITDFGILYGTFGNYTDPRADFNGDQVVDITDFSLLRGNFGQMGNRPGMAPPKQTGGSAVLEVRPQGKAPSNGGTVHVGDRFTLELWVNAQPGTNVVAQQSYLSFPAQQLQLGDSKMANPIGGGPTLVTPDNNVLDVTLQNGICDGPNTCSFNGLQVPAGSLAFASGTLNGTPGTGAFRVGQVTVLATAPGTAQLHWQFSPPDPSTRNTKIVSDSGETVSQPDQFVDYVLNILPPGK